MNEEEASEFLKDVTMQFSNYYKGVAYFYGNKDSHVLKGNIGFMVYEEAYNIRFDDKEDALRFLDEGTISIRNKDGVEIFRKEHEW